MIRKYNIYIALFSLLSIFSGCEKNIDKYNYKNGLNFLYENGADSVKNFSFVYGPSDKNIDTVWVQVETIGQLSQADREITFEQIQTSGTNAINGTHYVAFSDPTVKIHYKVPGGVATAKVPVILKRDATLKTTSVELYFKITENDNFKVVNPKRNRFKIIFTDKLSKPSNWAYYATAIFGVYGVVKHQFMIDQTGNKWDDDYLYNVMGFTSSSTSSGGSNSNYDSGFANYVRTSLINKLQQVNAARTAQGLDVLKESDGTLVAF